MKQFLFLILFLSFPFMLFSQTRELDIFDTDNDDDAVIQINSNDPISPNFTQMTLGFNLSNQGWLRTRTNHDLSFWTHNSRRLTIKNDGRVGVGTSNPAADFEVLGSTILESPNGTITITTNAATVEVLPNGNINILSSGNIDVDADGNLSLSADGDIDIDAGGSLNIDANTIDINTLQFDIFSQANLGIASSSIMSFQGSQIRLNSNGTSSRAARVGDIISIPSSTPGGGNVGGNFPILTGSNTVLIGN